MRFSSAFSWWFQYLVDLKIDLNPSYRYTVIPTIYKAYFFRPMYGDIPRKYGLIWYSTSILGS